MEGDNGRVNENVDHEFPAMESFEGTVLRTATGFSVETHNRKWYYLCVAKDG